MGRLENKVAIVVGGAGALGSKIVLRFLQEGAKVLIGDFSDELGDKVIAEMKAQGLNDVKYVHTDVTSPESVENMVKTAVKEFGKLDILCNSAGKQGAKFDVVHLPLETLQQFINVNIIGTWLCMKYACPELMKTQGNIVNIASIAGMGGSYGGTAYGGTKASVITMTYNVANEFGMYGVRANAISPAIMKTPETVLPEGMLQERRLRAPLHDVALFVDVANCALFLASEESRAITGLNLVVDMGTLTASQPFDMDVYLSNNKYEGFEPRK